MTPNTMDAMAPKRQEVLDREASTVRKGRSNPNNLRDQVAVNEGQRRWPTPRARDWKGDKGTTVWKNGRFIRVSNTTGIEYGATLDGAIAKWPTPQVDDAKNVNPKENRREGLVSRVNNWPTPSANEDAAGTPEGNMQRMLGNHPDVRGQGEGTLNPLWVTWLMGLPVGWVSLDPLPMEEYQEWIEGMIDGTWWDTEREIPRVARSVPGRVHMLKALGNGIVPNVIDQFLKRLTIHTL